MLKVRRRVWLALAPLVLITAVISFVAHVLAQKPAPAPVFIEASEALAEPEAVRSAPGPFVVDKTETPPVLRSAPSPKPSIGSPLLAAPPLPQSPMPTGQVVVRTFELAPSAAIVQQYNELEKLLQQDVKAYNEKGRSDKALRQTISEATSRQFDLRQQLQQLEVAKLKKRLEEVEAALAKREAAKEGVVERRVAQLLQEVDEYAWEPLSSPGYKAVTETFYVPQTLPNGDVVAVPRTRTRYVPSSTATGRESVYRGVSPRTYNMPQPGRTTPYPATPSKPVAPAANPYGVPKAVPGKSSPKIFSRVDPPTSAVTPTMKPTKAAPGVAEAAATSLSQMFANAGPSVREAQIKLEIATSVVQVTQLEYRAGKITADKMTRAHGEVRLAQAAYERALATHKARVKILEYSLMAKRKAAHIAVFDFDRYKNQSKTGAISNSRLRQLELAAAQADSAFAQTQVLLDLVKQDDPAPEKQPPAKKTEAIPAKKAEASPKKPEAQPKDD